MTTMCVNLVRLTKQMGNVERSNQNFIPPEVVLHTKAVIFLKKVRNGDARRGESPGILFARDGDNNWSLPISILFDEGSLRLHQMPYDMGDKADIMILVNDEKATNAFMSYGQCGFNSGSHRIVPGPVIGGRDEDVMKFVTELSNDPDVVRNVSFAYSLAYGKVQGCEFRDPVFQVRESSNQKFYENKNATCFNIVKNISIPNGAKERDVRNATKALSKFLFGEKNIVIRPTATSEAAPQRSLSTHRTSEHMITPVTNTEYQPPRMSSSSWDEPKSPQGTAAKADGQHLPRVNSFEFS